MPTALHENMLKDINFFTGKCCFVLHTKKVTGITLMHQVCRVLTIYVTLSNIRFLHFIHCPLPKNTKTESCHFRGRLYVHQVKLVRETSIKLDLTSNVLLNM